MLKIKSFIKSFIVTVTMTALLAGNIPIIEAATVDKVNRVLPMLQGLDIVESDYDVTNMELEQSVTRAEFAQYFVKLMNLPETDGKALYYNDVPKTHYAYNEITTLTEYNYMNGTDIKKFEPDAVMHKKDVYSVFERALTGDMAGNGTSSYYSEICSGTGSSDKLTISDLFVMMYNALQAECISLDWSRKGYIKGETLLYVTRHMYYEKNGFVSAVDGVDIYGDYQNDDYVVIDGKEYKFGELDLTSFLGLRAEFVYILEPNDDEPEIVWINKNDSTNEETVFIDEDANFDCETWTLTYYDESNRRKTEKIPRDISVIYNGTYLDSGIENVFCKDKYELTLIDDENTDKKIAIIWAYENIIVSDIYESDKKVIDKITGNEICLDSNAYNHLSIVMSDGSVADFSSIKSGDVLSIFTSGDGRRLKTIISRSVLNAEPSAFDSEFGVEIGNKYYEFYDKSSEKDLSSARSLTLKLDFREYIVEAQVGYTGKGTFVAYCYDVKYKQKDDAVVFKILKENGDLLQVMSGEKLSVDDYKYTNLADAVDCFVDASGNIIPQLLLFYENSEGKITRVYKADDHGGTSRKLIKNGKLPDKDDQQGLGSLWQWSAICRSAQMKIGDKMLYNSNTKVFNVPGDDNIASAAEKDFSVGAPIENRSYSGAISYKVTSEDIFFEQYIVHKGSIATDVSDSLLVVDSLCKGLNEDDEICTIINGMIGNKFVSYPVNEEYFSMEDSKISNGDILRIAVNDGSITNAQIVYNYGDAWLGQEQYGKGMYYYPEAENRYFAATVTAKEGSALRLSFKNTKTNDIVLNLISGGDNIIVYDVNEKSKNRARKGSVKDVRIGTFMVVRSAYNKNYDIVVYTDYPCE